MWALVRRVRRVARQPAETDVGRDGRRSGAERPNAGSAEPARRH